MNINIVIQFIEPETEISEHCDHLQNGSKKKKKINYGAEQVFLNKFFQ